MIALLLAACNSQAAAQATQATQTARPGSDITPLAAATAPVPSVPVSGTTGTPVSGGTATPRPTPTGAAPSDPTSLLNALGFFPLTTTLVKRDPVNLEGDNTPEMLYTLSGPGLTITNETNSALAVINYDPKYREWNLEWFGDPVDGTASPLPAANRADGYNGGDLLRNGSHVLALRTTTHDRRAHLYLYQWDTSKHQTVPLKMAGPNGAATNARFDGDLDVNLVDVNGDGVYEVVIDNLNGVQTWKWDGSKYVQEGGR